MVNLVCQTNSDRPLFKEIHKVRCSNVGTEAMERQTGLPGIVYERYDQHTRKDYDGEEERDKSRVAHSQLRFRGSVQLRAQQETPRDMDGEGEGAEDTTRYSIQEQYEIGVTRNREGRDHRTEDKRTAEGI